MTDAERCKTTILHSINHFIENPLDVLLAASGDEKEDAGNTNSSSSRDAALRLFHGAAELVPAYTEFLRSDVSVSPSTIKSFEDFENLVPLTDKANYFCRYPLPKRCIGGQISPGDIDFIHVSSGSTGEPTFWGRSVVGEVTVAQRFEQVLVDAFGCDSKRTLAVVAFPLGSWVGGIFTTFCLRYLTMKGYPITVVTPGNSPPEILRCVSALSPMYQRTCLLGYPPFLKGVIDAGVQAGVPWSTFDLCMVFAGEVFSESWRALVAERAGIKNRLQDMASLYGTADAGVIACETPLSASIRFFLSSRPALVKSLFGKERLPTLCQYDPKCRLLQVTPEGTIVVTALDGVPPEPTDGKGGADKAEGHVTSRGEAMVGPPPLVKYHIGDAGGIIAFQDLLDRLSGEGFDALAELGHPRVRRLPFCWVFGRAHWAVSMYGANIFVDHIMVGLEQGAVAQEITGKFVLSVGEDSDSNPLLSLDVELVKGIDPSGEAANAINQAVASSAEEHLVRLNSEYANYVPKDRRTPVVTLWPFCDSKYFPVGVKHVWTR